MQEDSLLLLLDIVVDTIGSYGKHSGAWHSFNCPHCAEENGNAPDGKYNCEVNIEEQYFHCWKCGYSGKISSIIKRYGTINQYNNYIETLKDVKISGGFTKVVVEEDNSVTLPKSFELLYNNNNYNARRAKEYLSSRGLTEEIIRKFSIGYVYRDEDFRFNNRIIIPSYDRYNSLNYFVGRDYTGYQMCKYMNPKVKKTEFIFNEKMVSWNEPVVLVEGCFDSIVVPNSIPLLGKILTEDSALYKALYQKAREDIYIFLDNDARQDALKMYKALDKIDCFHDKIRLVDTPQDYDPSDLFRDFGTKGILELLKNPIKIKECDLDFL